MVIRKLDLGCGPRKRTGYIGADIYAFEGVDHVFDFSSEHWPLGKGSFDEIYCSHVIEHVLDLKNFLRNIHEVGSPNATVEILTPHYSWVDSWSDPTHVHHFSTRWCRSFLDGEYLSPMVGKYQLVEEELVFTRSVRSWIPRFIVATLGLDTYERYYAWIFPAREVRTVLRIVK
jgi:SAM-dependent methyltransferase